MKNQSINLFSRTGITILSAITLPIFIVLILSLYFPKTWDSVIQSLGITKVSNSSDVVSVPTTSDEVPTSEACNRNYVSVKLDTFNQCLINGMSYNQVANILGYSGVLSAKSDNVETWQWNDGQGKYLSVVFINGKMASKSQVGLD